MGQMTLCPTIGCSDKGVGRPTARPCARHPSCTIQFPDLQQCCRPNIPALDLLTPKPKAHRSAGGHLHSRAIRGRGWVVVTSDWPPGGWRCWAAEWLGQAKIQAQFPFQVLMSSSLPQPPWHYHVSRDFQMPPICRASHSGGGIWPWKQSLACHQPCG